MNTFPNVVPKEPTPGLKAGTGRRVTLLLALEYVVVDCQLKLPTSIGVRSSPISVPCVLSWPPLMYCDENPVEGASEACSSRLLTVFLNWVSLRAARPL